MSPRAPLLLSLVFLGHFATPRADAILIAEDFNNYGSSDVALTGLNGGVGWESAWTANGAVAGYKAGNNLTYTGSTGYVNQGESGADDGSAFSNGNTASAGSDYAQRVYEPVSTNISGTVWISALVNMSNTNGNSIAFLMLEAGGRRLGFQGNQLRINNTGTQVATSTDTIAAGTTYLMLYKLEVNYSGTFDRIQGWINPADLTSEAGLGATDVLQEGVDIFGNLIDPNAMRIGLKGIASGDTIAMDAIRLSYGETSANGLSEVATGIAVPEPGSGTLVLAGVVGLSFLRSRSRSKERTGVCKSPLLSRVAAARHAGFTLIELLTVITIIAVLAALVFAVAPRMITTSRAATSMGQLRQIGVILLNYANDNNQCLPPAGPVDAAGVVTPWTKAPGMIEHLPLRQTGQENQIYVCPNARYAGFDNKNLSRTFSATGCFIGINPANGKVTQNSVARDRRTIDNPQTAVLLFDGRQQGANRFSRDAVEWARITADVSAASEKATAYADFRHLGRAHFLYADNHLESLTFTEFKRFTEPNWNGR